MDDISGGLSLEGPDAPRVGGKKEKKPSFSLPNPFKSSKQEVSGVLPNHAVEVILVAVSRVVRHAEDDCAVVALSLFQKVSPFCQSMACVLYL